MEFVDILRCYDIQQVVDVRRFPTSKFDHFKRGNLESHLSNAGIDYIHLGDKLGGYRKGGYETYTNTGKFSEGLNELEMLATEKTTCFMCAERLFWRCHRRFIADVLLQRGWQVYHIIEKGKIGQGKARIP